MLKVKIISIGKTKEPWLEEALDDYLKRLSPFMQIETVWAKNEQQMMNLALSNAIGLDPNGKMFDSLEFAGFLQQQFEKQGSRITFVIGGADGLPLQIKQNAPLISLSKLTFTHQITRLVLIEQLYRAMEITKGSPYHK